jgi:hypothetical protein
MNLLKIKIIVLLLFVLSFFVSGCYTVLWTPDVDFPDESYYSSSGGGYYYYDDYYYYYEYPWWLGITPPVKREINEENERSGSTGSIRNSGDGRGTGNSGNEVLSTPPATRSITTGNNENSNSSNNSGSTTRQSVEQDRSSSGSNSNENTRQRSNDSSNNTRNSDGNRNNNGRK